MCCCYCKSRFSKFPLISGVTKTLFNMVKKFEVNRTISKFSIICSLETFINQRDQTFLARSIRARITREKFLHVQKNVNIHTVKSVKSIRNILCRRQNCINLEYHVRRYDTETIENLVTPQLIIIHGARAAKKRMFPPNSFPGGRMSYVI